MGKKSKQKQNRRKQQPTMQSKPVMAMPTSTALGERLANPVKTSEIAADYAYIRTDMKKIGMLMTGVVVVLIATVIVNTRSNLLLDLGGTLARFMHLQ